MIINMNINQKLKKLNLKQKKIKKIVLKIKELKKLKEYETIKRIINRYIN